MAQKLGTSLERQEPEPHFSDRSLRLEPILLGRRQQEFLAAYRLPVGFWEMGGITHEV